MFFHQSFCLVSILKRVWKGECCAEEEEGVRDICTRTKIAQRTILCWQVAIYRVHYYQLSVNRGDVRWGVEGHTTTHMFSFFLVYRKSFFDKKKKGRSRTKRKKRFFFEPQNAYFHLFQFLLLLSSDPRAFSYFTFAHRKKRNFLCVFFHFLLDGRRWTGTGPDAERRDTSGSLFDTSLSFF